MTILSDVECMSLAMRLARLGSYTTHSNPNVGCVITDKNGSVVGKGFHKYFGEPHAEINALKEAGDSAIGGTAYVTLEPCCHQGKTGPCTNALVEAGIKKVIAAMEDPNPLMSGKGIKQLREQGINAEIGLLESQAKSLNRGFIKRMSTGMPWVMVKSATSLDGATALQNGQSKWITSEQARKDVHHLRAQYDAIMTGIGTVKVDNPSLNVRLDESIEVTQPLRIVIDPGLEIADRANLLSISGKKVIFTAKNPDDSHLGDVTECEIIQITELDDNNKYMCLRSVLSELAKRGVNSVMVEAGASLVGAFFKQQLVDELISYIAPKLMGDAAKGAINLGVIENMSECLSLEYKDVRKVGNDLRISSSVKYGES